jgi:hypothetical protein
MKNFSDGMMLWRMRHNVGMTQLSLAHQVGCTEDDIDELEKRSGIVDGPLARRVMRFFVSVGADRKLVQPLALGQKPYDLPISVEFTCGAKTRSGHPCRQWGTYANGRCRFHGGLSSGPKSEQGKDRIREGQRKRREREREAPRFISR